MTEKNIDIIIFGATGLVGRYGVRYLHKFTSKNSNGIRWALAGRNVPKIRNTLHQLYKETNDEEVLKLLVISADMSAPESIENMAKKTKILLNFCGPLRKQGEIVIRACIKFQTHYLDLSAEPNFIEKIQLEYDAEAKEAGIYIANSCGYDSLAYEMGVVFLQKNMRGPLNSVETYLRYGEDKSGLSGPDFNTATWNSVVDLLGNSSELENIRKGREDKWPELKPKLPHRVLPFKPEYEEGWAVLSPSADLTVMRRTQQFLYEEKNTRPIQIESYFMFTNIFHIIFFVISGSILHLLSKSQCGRALLLKYPSLFSGGVFGTEEPSEDKLNNNWCSLTLVGKGWSNEQSRGLHDPDREIVARIKGYNTGYKLTSLCLVLSGIVVLTEPNLLSKRRGVLTPGVLFSETTIIKQLHENGLRFDIIKKDCFRVKNKL